MKIQKTKLILLFYLLLVTIAEILASYLNAQVGLLAHFILLLIFVIHYTLINMRKHTANTLQCRFIEGKRYPSRLMQLVIDDYKQFSSILLTLTLIPMIRILSLVMPLYNFAPLYWFVLIGIAIYLSFIILKIQQKIPLSDIGFKRPHLKHYPLEFAIILLAIPMGIAEFFILQPEPLVTSFTVYNVVIVIIIFFVTVGLMEEIIFRGLLQNNSIDILGPKKGILFTTLIFTALHIGNLSILDCLLVFIVGGLYGITVYKTKSIIGVTISHTIVNIFLFIICPVFLA